MEMSLQSAQRAFDNGITTLIAKDRERVSQDACLLDCRAGEDADQLDLLNEVIVNG